MSPAPDAPRILAVDDERHIRELVRLGLGTQGFAVTEAATGREALARIEAEHPDLVVLDVLLPDLDGFEVARRLRAAAGPHRDTPVIFLTARDTLEDRLEGLRIGTDDYVTKPFSIEELAERVRAVLRRSGRTGPASTRLHVADLEIDTDTREVWRGGHAIDLTATEFRLLVELASASPRVLTRQQLLEGVWDYTFTSNASVLETYVSYLRAKIDTVEPHLLQTVRGVGYVLRAPRS
ncbi:MAG: response regulator transcription factor [Nitriliruptoraceae bacterium]